MARFDKRILLMDIMILVILGNLILGISLPFPRHLKHYCLEDSTMFLYSLGDIPTYFLNRREK